MLRKTGHLNLGGLVAVGAAAPVQATAVGTSTAPMILIKTHENVPLTEVGAFVQQCVAGGAKNVFVTRNPDGRTCTVRVQPD